MGISNFPTRFKADFGLFRPFQLPADMTQYGRYGPILAESARFGVNQCESKPNWRESSQVGTNPRGKKKKSSNAALIRKQPCWTPRPVSDLGAAPSQPHPCFLVCQRHGSDSQYRVEPLYMVTCGKPQVGFIL